MSTKNWAGQARTYGRRHHCRAAQKRSASSCESFARVYISPSRWYVLHMMTSNFTELLIAHKGTLISMSSTPNLDMTAPITARINQPDSLLRKTADPSLLVQSLLDLRQSSSYLYSFDTQTDYWPSFSCRSGPGSHRWISCQD